MNQYEIIGFRFMILFWIIGSIMIFSYAYSRYSIQSYSNSIPEAKEWTFDCMKGMRESVFECHPGSFNDSFSTDVDEYIKYLEKQRDVCSKEVSDVCSDRSNPKTTKYIYEKIEFWKRQGEIFFNLSFIVIIVPTLLFYGVRWGITGKLRPMWLLGKTST